MDPEPGSLFHLFLLQVNVPTALLGQILLFVGLIVISFLVSGAEVAFFSLSKSEVEEFKEDDSRQSRRIWHLLNRPKKLLATILITNNFVNVAAILVASYILRITFDFEEIDQTVAILLNVVLITSFLLFFGEIIPKVYAAKNRKKLVVILATPIEWLGYLVSPLAWVLIHGTSFIDKRLQFREKGHSVDDIKHAIELTATDEADKDQKEILKGIVNFKSIPVKQIMTARVDVEAIPLDIEMGELISFINEHNHSRLPVYEKDLDHIAGVIHIKDLLPYLRSEGPEFDLKPMLRSVHFIPENKKIDVLLEEFKSRREHLAVVVDEFGGTAGIVSLEDVIEEIFGELNDEFDREDWVFTKVSDTTYIFEGRISLNDVRKIIELDDEVFEDARGDSDSLGGLILELHGKIPTVGELITYRNFELHVESVSRHRINQVKFVILEKEAAGAEE